MLHWNSVLIPARQVEGGSADIPSLLISASADPNASGNPPTRSTIYFIPQPPSPPPPDNYHSTALICAARRGDLASVSLLMRVQSCDPGLRSPCRRIASPYYRAVSRAFFHVLSWLTPHSRSDHIGNTALHYACMHGHHAVADALLQVSQPLTSLADPPPPPPLNLPTHTISPATSAPLQNSSRLPPPPPSPAFEIHRSRSVLLLSLPVT